MTALAAAVFLASLTGSVHCAGMCGPLVALGLAGGRRDGPGQQYLQAAYNGGRLAIYTTLGALAGGLGSALDLGGAYLGLQRVALALAGAAMVAFGGVTLLRLAGARVPAVPLPAGLRRRLGGGHAAAAKLDPVPRAALFGLLSAFLPCGWLYAFVVTAAGTGSAVHGAGLMAVFWAGTLPVMLALGAGVRALAGPLRRHLPAVAALGLVVVGSVALAGRLRVPALSTAHAPASAAASVEALDPHASPCCARQP